MESKEIIKTNSYQTKITEELLAKYPDEVVDEFMEYVNTVPLIKWMIGERPRAKDLPRDEEGKIIIDIAHPHILEDMDYFIPARKHYLEHGCYTLLRPNNNKNSEYGKWLVEEMRRCRDGYVRESDGEWVTGQMYFFMNYCPIMLNKKVGKTFVRTEGFPDFWEGIYLRTHCLQLARQSGKHVLELARRGCSKAHPYTEKVITPDGEREWRDIKIGDRLFGDDGLPTTVVDIPFDGECDTYRITLRDGRQVYASDEHLWNVLVHHHSRIETLSTKELLSIYKRKHKVSERCPSGVEYICGIPANGAVDFQERDVLIDPYTLGVMLGDGCLTSSTCCLSENEDDFAFISQHIPYEWKKWQSYCSYGIRIPQWREKITHYGLYGKKSSEKFIPDDYKYNTKEVRLSVLKGLMDTDGYLGKHEVYTITTVSERLATDIRWLCWSLGYNTTMTKKKSGYKKNGEYIRCNDSYVISIYTTDAITNIPRKTKKHWNSRYAQSRALQSRIVNIEYVGRMQSKCVTVDNASHSYLIGNFVVTHNSFTLASIMAHNLILGENSDSKERVTTILMAYLKEFLADKDGTLTKFAPMIDFCSINTGFPRLMLRRSMSEMSWRMGYKNANGNEMGSLNSVAALSMKDDEGKARGKRGFLLYEEMGSFPNFKQTWDNARDSVKEGNNVFGLMYGVGTAGDDASDFSGVKTMLYNPDSYDVYSIDNVFDKAGKGTDKFAFFFPSYISRAGCMDKDGNSDVVKAIFEILMERWRVKQSGDSASYLSRVAQMPITPAEAILKVQSNFFPVAMINERINQLDKDPRAFDDVYVGTVVDVGGRVEFRATDDVPIREFGVDNTSQGAVEIFEMPCEGQIPANRYIIGQDPVDNDQAESKSLSSVFVFDMFTDRIVAEFTGRKPLAEDNYEITLLLSRLYNAQVMFEANRKGMFAYFSKKRELHRLADCPEYLRDRQLVKYSAFGSASKGITVNNAINAYADTLIRDWLLKTVPMEVKDENGNASMQNVPQLYTIRNRALLQELVSYAPGVNVDRIRALSQVMLFREHFMVLYGGAPVEEKKSDVETADEEFFNRDWSRHNAMTKRWK